MVYQCLMCEKYETRHKCNLEKHLLGRESRRFQDQPEKLSKIRAILHILYPNKYEQDASIHDLKDQVQQMSHQLQTLSQKINDQTTVLSNPSTNSTPPTVNVNLGTINNIHLNFYGHTNDEMLTYHFMRKLLEGKMPHNAVEMFAVIFLNDHYPENHVLHFPNKKRIQELMAFTKEGWKMKQFRILLKDFIEKDYRTYMRKCLDKFYDMKLLTYEEWDHLSDQMFDDSYDDQIIEEIRRELINNRHLTSQIYEQTKHITTPDLAHQIGMKAKKKEIPALVERPEIKVSQKKIIKVKVRNNSKRNF